MPQHRTLWRMQWFTCHECGRDIPEPNTSQFHSYWHRGRMYCSRKCSTRYVSRLFKRPPRPKAPKVRLPRRYLWRMQWFTCHECGADIPDPTTNQFKAFRQADRMFCSNECSWRFRGRLSSRRMSARNPMSNPEVRERVSKTLRHMGHEPAQRGGKGRGMTIPQKILLERLGPEWEAELVIKTGLPKRDGNPTWYSADLAHSATRTCVEVDGGSHCCLKVQQRDARRDAILSQLGWTTLRFSNEEILANTEAVVQTIRSITCRWQIMRTTSPRISSSTTVICSRPTARECTAPSWPTRRRSIRTYGSSA